MVYVGVRLSLEAEEYSPEVSDFDFFRAVPHFSSLLDSKLASSCCSPLRAICRTSQMTLDAEYSQNAPLNSCHVFYCSAYAYVELFQRAGIPIDIPFTHTQLIIRI